MTDFRWGDPTTEASIAGTAFDNKATGSANFIADFTNGGGNRRLFLHLFGQLGSINTAAGASIRFELRRKRGSTYAANAAAEVTVPILQTGTSTKEIAAELQFPGPHTYGLYWVSALGTNSAASSNTLFEQQNNEADA